MISGNGRIIFAVTEAGRLRRVDSVTEQVEELLPRTPWIGEVSGSSWPGSEVRIRGGGLWGDPADIIVEWQNQRVPVLSATDDEIRVRMPLLESPIPTPVLFWANPLDAAAPPEPFLKVSVPSDSPLRLVPFSRNIEYAERNGAGIPWGTTFRSPGPRHEDGSVVTSANPARVGEVLSIRVSGVDSTASVPLRCLGHEVISALPSAGQPGVYEVRFRVTGPITGWNPDWAVPSVPATGLQLVFASQ